MRRASRHTLALGIALAVSPVLASPVLAAERRVEAAAKDALKRAANDYLATDYATGAARLQRAVRTCGTVKCTAQTRALLLRDLGTMQFRNGDLGAARKNWAEAVKLQPDVELNPDYDTADLHAAWDEVKGAAGGGARAAAGVAGGGGGAPQPSGDFTHTPAAEQKVNTPLPVYVEYPGSSTVARVLAKYKGATASSWSHVMLKRMGSGWGGVIPCGDVTKGTMRYWIQGFDEGGDPIASSGDPKQPYTVPIRDQLGGEPPHLPNKSPPRACTAGAEVAETESESEEGPATPTEEEPEKIAKAEKGGYARFWFGVSGVIPEFAQLPGGDAVCKLTGAALPANSSNFYCTNPDGSDFPSRLTPAQNEALTNPAAAGNVNGGVHPGDLRVLATFDYALSPRFLLGARIGGVINAYPGKAAVSDGKAFGSKLDVEARATYLFGDEPLAHTGFAPSFFVGLGIAEFDVHTTSVVSLNDLAGQYPVRVWLTDGPFFFEFGPGIRYQFSPRAALAVAARVNAVIGGNGFMLTYGPEFGFMYGF